MPEYPEDQLPNEEWVELIRNTGVTPILAIQPWLEGPSAPAEWRDAWNRGEISADFATLAVWYGVPAPSEWAIVEWQPLSNDVANILVTDQEGNQYIVPEINFQVSKDLFFLDVKPGAEAKDADVIINPSP